MTPQRTSAYARLQRSVQQPADAKGAPKPESEVDTLLSRLQEQQNQANNTPEPQRDRLDLFRDALKGQFGDIFHELEEKYAPSGIAMSMDASDLLAGGRSINFEFVLGEWRLQLTGTATSDAIAFEEIRHTPVIQGEIASGPRVSLRTLDAKRFREFVCERLAQLVRAAMKKR